MKCAASEELKKIPGLVKKVRKRYRPLVKAGLIKSIIKQENKTLLSSLEKEEQAHTMSVYDLNMKIAELGIALEKEKEKNERLNRVYNLELERVNKAENKHFQTSLELAKEKERADKAEKEVYHLTNTLLEQSDGYFIQYRKRAEQAEERMKELVEAVKKHHIKHDACVKNEITEWEMSRADEELYKVLEEVNK